MLQHATTPQTTHLVHQPTEYQPNMASLNSPQTKKSTENFINDSTLIFPIQLTIHFARNLHKSSFLKQPSPFVRLYKYGKQDKITYLKSTSVVNHENNPQFNTNFKLNDYKLNLWLQLEIWDDKKKDRGAKKGFLGGAILNPQQIVNFCNHGIVKLTPLSSLRYKETVNKTDFANSALYIQIKSLNFKPDSSLYPTLVAAQKLYDQQNSEKSTHNTKIKTRTKSPENLIQFPPSPPRQERAVDVPDTEIQKQSSEELSLEREQTHENQNSNSPIYEPNIAVTPNHRQANFQNFGTNTTETSQKTEYQTPDFTQNTQVSPFQQPAQTIIRATSAENLLHNSNRPEYANVPVETNHADYENFTHTQSQSNPTNSIHSSTQINTNHMLANFDNEFNANGVIRNRSPSPRNHSPRSHSPVSRDRNNFNNLVQQLNNSQISTPPVPREYIPPPPISQSRLPKNWERTIDDHGRVYYFNSYKNESTWYDPRIPILKREKIIIPDPDYISQLRFPWRKESKLGKNGKPKVYFINEADKICQNTDPRVVIWLDDNFEKIMKKQKRKSENPNATQHQHPINGQISSTVPSQSFLPNQNLQERMLHEQELKTRRSLAKKLHYAKENIFGVNYIHGIYCRINLDRREILEHSYRIILGYRVCFLWLDDGFD